ncbi:MAG: RNA 2',3'-cyclic phosphodiesterase [Bacteroidetes bacterium]|nr:RNA 2',3'-cyclic phosphodiesterase [Bacteroidota bacterium]
MKRLFAAIETAPDKEFLEQNRKLKKQLGQEKIKFVEEHNLHITLKFFGETEEKRIPDIIRILNAVALRTESFNFRLEGLGVFGSRYDPRVVWAGIQPYDKLASLMKEVGEDMKSIGYQPDRQNLIPHLTIGRIRELRDKQFFQKVIDENKTITSGEMIVESIILFESILKKEGPVYLSLQKFPLLPENG